MIANTWQKGKVGAYLGSITVEGIEDFYTEIMNDEIQAGNSKIVMKNYIADRVLFKTNVLEMIKASMDASFADYDEVVAKNTK